MSSRLDKAIKDFIQIIREAGNKGTSPLDAQAEVLRIDEDGTAWVHLPGGVDETPVKLTINAEVGDKVYVRLSGGRAWITGNQTAPPTDDKTAIAAKSLANIAGNRAKIAQKVADQAQIAANSALKGTKENAAQMAQMVIDFNGDIENLQDQIDGNIATWFYDVDPAINLPPVTDWDTDEEKNAHLGDIYYNTVKGYAWRFMKSGSIYSWERITDTDVTKALADAAKAQDTADSKRRVFYNTPTVPYDAGDLWVQGSGGDILRCAQAKTNTGSYDRNDWVLASKYTDNSALTTWIEGDFATIIQGLEEGLADAKIETYYQTTDPSTGWSDTQKSEHKGDLWYNSTASVQKYYRWSGTAWQELTATPPQAVFDSIDKKATIYTGTTTPTNPDSGDLWFKGADEPILTYVNNSWVEYNKYTDDSAVNNLEIGGRNLILKSETKPISKYIDAITTQTGIKVSEWGTNNAIRSYGVCNSNKIFGTLATGSSSPTSAAGQAYVHSIYVKNNGETPIIISNNGIGGSRTIQPGESTRVILHGTGDNARYLQFVFFSSNLGDAFDVTYWHPKIEIGDKATDWTPAPEDVDAGIANATKVATNYLHYDGTNGLVLGNKESGSWVGYRTQIGTDSFNVLDENGDIIASYGSNEVELGKGNPSAIIKMCDGKAYVKNYIVGSQNTSVFCGQEVTVVGEWEGASEAYALFKQGFINIGQASSYIRLFNEHDNMNQVVIQGQNIRMVSASTIGNFDCYMKPRFFTMAGEIKMWAGDAIPDGWLLCDGSEVSKTKYPKLYKAIGDLWGVPSSSSNFKLPNLTGRVPVGYNSADTDTTETFGKVGATGGARGAWYHTHTIGSSGAHHHASQGRMEGSGTGANIFESYNGASKTRSVNVPRTGDNGAHTHSPGSSGSSGNKLAADKANMPPYAVVKYIICAI